MYLAFICSPSRPSPGDQALLPTQQGRRPCTLTSYAHTHVYTFKCTSIHAPMQDACLCWELEISIKLRLVGWTSPWARACTHMYMYWHTHAHTHTLTYTLTHMTHAHACRHADYTLCIITRKRSNWRRCIYRNWNNCMMIFKINKKIVKRGKRKKANWKDLSLVNKTKCI